MSRGRSAGDRRRPLRRALGAACGLSLGLLALLAAGYGMERRRVLTEVRHAARAEAAGAARRCDGVLRGIMAVNRSLVDRLSRGPLPDDRLDRLLAETVAANPGLFGAAVAYLPGAAGRGDALFARYYGRPDGRVQPIPIRYDYTAPGEHTEWFRRAVRDGPGWREPHFARASRTWLASYTAPLHHPDPAGGEPALAGVVVTSVSIREYRALIDGLDLGKTGYGFLLSARGAFVVHPREGWVGRRISELDDPELRALTARALAREEETLEHLDPVTGQASWVLSERIPASGWTLGVVFIRDEVAGDGPELPRRRVGLILAAVLTALLLVAWSASRRPAADLRRLWRLSFALSLVWLGGTVALVHWGLLAGDAGDGEAIALVDPSGVEHFVAGWALRAPGREAPVRLPTGVLLQSLSFAGATEVAVKGYVWQRYDREATRGLARGFVLPDAVDLAVGEAYRRDDTDAEVWGWTFEGVVRQDFSHRCYPFDRKHVRIRLWPRDFDRNVVLTPDLAAYGGGGTSKTTLAAMAPELPVPGWRRRAVYFSYRLYSHGTSFGIARFAGREEAPELAFNVELAREAMSELFNRLLPLGVAAILLFALLVSTTADPEKKARLDFRFTGFLGAASGLFFVVVLSHVQLRRELLPEEPIYLEYFYLAVYLAILLTSVNAFLVAMRPDLAWVRWRDNLIPKLAFWPFLSAVGFGATWVSLG